MSREDDAQQIAIYCILSKRIAEVFAVVRQDGNHMDWLEFCVSANPLSSPEFAAANAHTQAKLRGYYDALFDRIFETDVEWSEEQQSYLWKGTNKVFCNYNEMPADKLNNVEARNGG